MGVHVQPDIPVRPGSVKRPGVILAAVAAGIAFGMVVIYLLLIRRQGDGIGLRVLLVASCVLAAGTCAAGAVWSASRQRRLVLMAAAAGGLTSLGIIGMWSIGLPLFIGGVLMIIGSVRLAHALRGAGRSRLPALAASVAAFFLPVAVLFTPR